MISTLRGGILSGSHVTLSQEDLLWHIAFSSWMIWQQDQLHLRSLLRKHNYQVEAARSYEEALQVLQEQKFHLLLLDVFMPDVDGFETCSRLRSQEQWQDLPIIFVTASDDQEIISRCFQVGGSDYIGKFSPAAELLARIKTQIRLSETLQAEREEQRLLSSGLNAFPEDVIIVSASGEIIFFNDRAQQLLRTQDSELPKTVAQLPPKVKAFFALDEHMSHFLELRSPKRMIVESNQRLRRVAVSPVKGGPRNILLIASRDITEENRMQRHLRNAQKMTALSQIAGGLAHDLNNVLSGTITYLSILKMHADERGRSIIANLESASQRSANLVGQLLEFSRLDEEDQQIFSLNSLLSQCEALLQRVGGDELIPVEMEVENAELTLNLSRLLLQHALVNVAQKVYRSGQGLTLRCRHVELDESLPLPLQGITGEDWCCISIFADDYLGYDEKSVVAAGDNICGLSLSIAHNIVEDAGGMLYLEGDPQLPLAAHLYLPVAGG